MKVYRKVKMNVSRYEVGDQITIKIKGYGKFTATVQKIENGLALFLFDNCICRHETNREDTNEGGFERSDMCEFLNNELLKSFPKKLVNRMHYPDGFFLFLLSEEDVVGDDALPLMKEPRNRACAVPDEDYCANWWLRDVVNSTNFAIVYSNGFANYSSASGSNGVRPAFYLSETDL